MILSAAELRRTVEQVLRARLPLALMAVEAHLDLPMPVPVTWERLADFTTIAERASPAVVVTTPGITPGARDADGDYTARGEVRVFAVVRGRDYAETADRVAGYVTAIRWSLLADEGLDGLARGVTWTGEAHAELASDTNRTIGAGSVSVRYDFDSPGSIPQELLPAGLRFPTVSTVHVDVDPLETAP